MCFLKEWYINCLIETACYLFEVVYFNSALPFNVNHCYNKSTSYRKYHELYKTYMCVCEVGGGSNITALYTSTTRETLKKKLVFETMRFTRIAIRGQNIPAHVGVLFEFY